MDAQQEVKWWITPNNQKENPIVRPPAMEASVPSKDTPPFVPGGTVRQGFVIRMGFVRLAKGKLQLEHEKTILR